MGVKRPWQIYALLGCYLLGILYIINFMSYGLKNFLSYCISSMLILIFIVLIALLFIRRSWAYKAAITLYTILLIYGVINLLIILFMPSYWLIVTPIAFLLTIYSNLCSATRIYYGYSNNELIEIDLFSFIKNGTFGNIEIGMSKEEILQIFPAPDDWMHGLSMSHSPIWRYGNFELHFENQRLIFIFNDYVDEISLGDQLKIKKWLFKNQNIYLKDILNEFVRQNILYARTDSKNYIELVVRNSNVSLKFSNEENNKLTSITKNNLSRSI